MSYLRVVLCLFVASVLVATSAAAVGSGTLGFDPQLGLEFVRRHFPAFLVDAPGPVTLSMTAVGPTTVSFSIIAPCGDVVLMQRSLVLVTNETRTFSFDAKKAGTYRIKTFTYARWQPGGSLTFQTSAGHFVLTAGVSDDKDTPTFHGQGSYYFLVPPTTTSIELHSLGGGGTAKVFGPDGSERGTSNINSWLNVPVPSAFAGAFWRIDLASPGFTFSISYRGPGWTASGPIPLAESVDAWFNPAPIAPCAPTALRNDFDGDGKSDLVVFRPSEGFWYALLSAGGTTGGQWGTTGDVPISGSFDADLKADFGVFRPSEGGWYVSLSNGGSTGMPWGQNGDIPLPADYDKDGVTDYAVSRPAGGWYRYLSSGGVENMTGQGYIVAYRAITDIAVPGDYDGDGVQEQAIFHSDGTWTVQLSSGGTKTVAWGIDGDVPVAGDYDGDGRSDFAVYRPSIGAWYILHQDGSTAGAFWGSPGDIPVVK